MSGGTGQDRTPAWLRKEEPTYLPAVLPRRHGEATQLLPAVRTVDAPAWVQAREARPVRRYHLGRAAVAVLLGLGFTTGYLVCLVVLALLQ